MPMKTTACLVVVLLGALAGRAALSAHADISGQWSVEFSAGDVQNEADMQMYISQSDSRLTGHIEWNASASDFPLKGTIADDQFQIVWTTRVNGVISDITFRGVIKGEELSGAVEIPGHQTGELYARRVGR